MTTAKGTHANESGAFNEGATANSSAKLLLTFPLGHAGPVADAATNLPLLRLPEGFSYRSFSRAGASRSSANSAIGTGPESPRNTSIDLHQAARWLSLISPR